MTNFRNIYSSDLSHRARSVYMYLKDRADKDDKCWPAIKTIGPSYYCRDCRAKLTKVATQGYVLLDLYDLDAIQVYPVEDSAEYPIRIYTVTTAHDEDQGHLVVTNIGHLFES